jgi:hypothetical protein
VLAVLVALAPQRQRRLARLDGVPVTAPRQPHRGLSAGLSALRAGCTCTACALVTARTIADDARRTRAALLVDVARWAAEADARATACVGPDFAAWEVAS